MDSRPTELASLIVALLVFVLSSVEGDIRCFCNQGGCVSTSYMCKSRSVCFSDLQGGLHGCLENKKRCLGLQCCEEDMCNYRHIDMRTPPVTGALDDDPSENRIAILESAMRREVWFKAAVIATPIAGLCILVLLAAAAARMLRQDAVRQRRLLEIRRTIYGHRHALLMPWHKEKGATIV